jgi:two-component sensor histidine kinase
MDNGIGLNKESKTQGLGMRLIDIFARQIDMSYELKNENGVMYIFKIPFINDEK